MNKPFFIRENTRTWTNSSCWLLLLEDAWKGASRHRHGPATCPAGSHAHPVTSTYRQYGKRTRTQPMYVLAITQCTQIRLQTGLGRQLQTQPVHLSRALRSSSFFSLDGRSIEVCAIIFTCNKAAFMKRLQHQQLRVAVLLWS